MLTASFRAALTADRVNRPWVWGLMTTAQRSTRNTARSWQLIRRELAFYPRDPNGDVADAFEPHPDVMFALGLITNPPEMAFLTRPSGRCWRASRAFPGSSLRSSSPRPAGRCGSYPPRRTWPPGASWAGCVPAPTSPQVGPAGRRALRIVDRHPHVTAVVDPVDEAEGYLSSDGSSHYLGSGTVPSRPSWGPRFPGSVASQKKAARTPLKRTRLRQPSSAEKRRRGQAQTTPLRVHRQPLQRPEQGLSPGRPEADPPEWSLGTRAGGGRGAAAWLVELPGANDAPCPAMPRAPGRRRRAGRGLKRPNCHCSALLFEHARRLRHLPT